MLVQGGGRQRTRMTAPLPLPKRWGRGDLDEDEGFSRQCNDRLAGKCILHTASDLDTWRTVKIYIFILNHND